MADASNIGVAIARAVRQFRVEMRALRVGRDHHKHLTVEAVRVD